MLACSQAYLKLLLHAIGSSKGKSAKSPAEARVAARCMCAMLSTLHHFNYAADLLQAVVPLMVSGDHQLRQLSCEAIREVLMNDEEGKVAVEAVQLVGLASCTLAPAVFPFQLQPPSLHPVRTLDFHFINSKLQCI